MKRILGVLILGLFAAAAFSMRAIADDAACCPGMKKGMHEKMMGAMHERMDKKIELEEMFFHKAGLIMKNAAELGLSDDQLQKVKTLKLDAQKSMIKADADVELLVLDIQAALEKDEIDVNNINSLIDKKYGIKSQAAKVFVGAYGELKKVLNKDQMKKLHEIWKKEKMQDGKCAMMEGKEGHEHKK